MNLISSRPTLIVCLLMMLPLPTAIAQQTYPTTAPADDSTFEPIFDGHTLQGWDGDSKFWRVENNAIVGEITPGNEIKRNTFLIWTGITKDFELKLQYRISSKGNSGINYRSTLLEDAKFSLKGYQFDIDGDGRSNGGQTRHTGNNYEERARTFMALRGQVVQALEPAQRHVIASVGPYKDLAKFIREEDWNEAHIIARNNTLIHILNGQVMAVLIDDDAKNRTPEGKLGVQVHVGPPMKVEFRNIRLKKL